MDKKFDLKIKTRIGWDGLGVTCFFLSVFRGEVQKRMGKDGKVSYVIILVLAMFFFWDMFRIIVTFHSHLS